MDMPQQSILQYLQNNITSKLITIWLETFFGNPPTFPVEVVLSQLNRLTFRFSSSWNTFSPLENTEMSNFSRLTVLLVVFKKLILTFSFKVTVFGK